MDADMGKLIDRPKGTLDDRSIYAFCDFETTGVDPDSDFPIEVGLVFVDGTFRELSSFESLIRLVLCPANYAEAERIHGIPFTELVDAPTPTNVVEAISRRCRALRNMHEPVDRIVLVSDNAQFEHRFMERLYAMAGAKSVFPFHYCTWDTSLLLELTRVGDNPNPAHRALADAYDILMRVKHARTLLL
tara:strand:+ start:5064 stop:5630 length:567 start_codon:yes stop_codon:yes gene_type:complete